MCFCVGVYVHRGGGGLQGGVNTLPSPMTLEVNEGATARDGENEGERERGSGGGRRDPS